MRPKWQMQYAKKQPRAQTESSGSMHVSKSSVSALHALPLPSASFLLQLRCSSRLSLLLLRRANDGAVLVVAQQRLPRGAALIGGEARGGGCPKRVGDRHFRLLLLAFLLFFVVCCCSGGGRRCSPFCSALWLCLPFRGRWRSCSGGLRFLRRHCLHRWLQTKSDKLWTRARS